MVDDPAKHRGMVNGGEMWSKLVGLGEKSLRIRDAISCWHNVESRFRPCRASPEDAKNHHKERGIDDDIDGDRVAERRVRV